MEWSRYTPEQLAEFALLLERQQQLEQLSEAEQQRLEYRATLEASPADFFKAAWNVLEPGRNLIWSPHYDLISEWLMKVWRRECLRLIINVPPRTAKSTEGTICFPAWGWARDPRHRFLTASYSRDLSREHSAKRRNLIDSEWYRSLWPIAFSDDTNRADQYKNDQQGEMIATSVGATGTGRGGDTLILDDGLSADQAQSEAERKTAHAWFRETFRTRLNDPATGAIVVIEQRTHHEDITGWLLKNEPHQWKQVIIPLVQDEKTDLEIVFPVSGRKWERKIGDVLQPDRHTPAVVAAQQIHRRTFETQAQQRPSPEGGDICKREWWKFYRAVPDDFDQVIDSWDLTFKESKDSDFVAGFKVGVKGARRYFLEAIHARMGFTASKDAVKRLRMREPVASRVLIEDKANGPAVIDALKMSVPGLIPIEPTGSKYARAVAATGDIEAGNVYLPDPEEFPQHRAWVDTLIEEWAIFPNGPNDDAVDASGQAINYTRSAMGNIADYYREVAAEVEAAKKPPAKVQQKPARQWSESLRVVRMGILPSGPLDTDEVEDWIAFCEEHGNQDAANLARAVLAQAQGMVNANAQPHHPLYQ